MSNQDNYIRDLAEIRSMMERSSKFLSLSGWAGIMAGIYALGGAYIAYAVFDFAPDRVDYYFPGMPKVIIFAVVILLTALVTAIYFSYRNAAKKGEKIRNATSRKLLAGMAVPLAAGGILILFLILKGFLGLAAPLTLLFYGLALCNAAEFTISEVKLMGIVQIILGLASSWFVEYSLIFWAIGFGVVHIVYGIYMYFRYEK